MSGGTYPRSNESILTKNIKHNFQQREPQITYDRLVRELFLFSASATHLAPLFRAVLVERLKRHGGKVNLSRPSKQETRHYIYIYP